MAAIEEITDQVHDPQVDAANGGVRDRFDRTTFTHQEVSNEDSTQNEAEIPPEIAEEQPLPSAEEMMSIEHAELLKKEGNALFAELKDTEALEKYTEALNVCPVIAFAARHRSVFFANRAAVHLREKRYANVVEDCSAALELDATYVKALLRRCNAYEALDDLERALSDAQEVVKLDPQVKAAHETVRRLLPVVEERREKLKDEMMGKLKDLGNMVLGKFGMSLDSFKAEKDPNTGGYSINFKG